MSKQLPRRGFTLVELMIVVVIIGILTGLTLKVIGTVRRAAQTAATKNHLAVISTAIQAYYNDYRSYPGPIPNSQLGIAYYPSPPAAGDLPFTGLPGTDNQHVTGMENLVLGLLGGLRVDTTTGKIVYDPSILFPDGTNPNPRGPASLNLNLPKRQLSYLQVRPGDLSPNGQYHYYDIAGYRYADDSAVPEFMDNYNDRMPILYIRASIGATAVVGLHDTDGTTQLMDTSTNPPTPVRAQWDIAQAYGYLIVPKTSSQKSAIGLSESAANNFHGLRGIGTGTVINDATGPFPAAGGSNGYAYFRDPSAASNLKGPSRNKDGFILISPGPDRIYGTADDVITPGTLE